MGVSFFCYLTKKNYLLQILKSSSVVGFDMRRKEEKRGERDQMRREMGV
jgi:hypothetical protein